MLLWTVQRCRLMRDVVHHGGFSSAFSPFWPFTRSSISPISAEWLIPSWRRGTARQRYAFWKRWKLNVSIYIWRESTLWILAHFPPVRTMYLWLNTKHTPGFSMHMCYWCNLANIRSQIIIIVSMNIINIKTQHCRWTNYQKKLSTSCSGWAHIHVSYLHNFWNICLRIIYEIINNTDKAM